VGSQHNGWHLFSRQTAAGAGDGAFGSRQWLYLRCRMRQADHPLGRPGRPCSNLHCISACRAALLCSVVLQGIKNVPTRLRIVIQRKRNEDDEDSVSAAAGAAGRRWLCQR